MNELITINDGNALLNPEVAEQIADFEKKMKEIKEAEAELKESILAEMEDKGILSIDTDELKISYIAPTDRETFDKKSFQKDYADIYDEYVKMSPVKASIRIKVK